MTGAAIGWLTTVMADPNAEGPAKGYLLAGIAGALALGLLVDAGDIFSGLSPLALLAGTFGSFIALGAYSQFRSAQTG